MKRQETTKDVYHPDYYTNRINEETIEEVERYVYGEEEGSKKYKAGKIAIEKYYKEQQDKKHEELRKLAVHTLDAQRDGNKTQKEILKVLVLTVVVSIMLAIFNNW